MTATTALPRRVLVPARSAADASSGREAKIRHYRLARLAVNASRDPRGESRFAHLRRGYD